MLEQFKRKSYYIFLRFSIVLLYALAWLYSFIYKRRNKTSNKKIAAIWYYPPDIPGSRDRLGHWKSYFEKKGFQYDNFYVSSIKEEFREFEIGSWSKKYWFYTKIFYRRFVQYLSLKNYDIVWIDRGFIPKYPLKKAFFERCIRRMVNRLVVDSSDFSDFSSNPGLVLDTIAQADTLTVAFQYLFYFFKTSHLDVRWINYTLPTENYISKKEYDFKGLPVLGWMGSPANMVHLKNIESQLKEVSKKRPFKLIVICRNPVKLDIPGAVLEYHPYNDEYYNMVNSFDIGVFPVDVKDEDNKGRIAMKHQEFMMCAIPQVCAPVAISEASIDGDNVLIALKPEDWTNKLLQLLNDEGLRERLGKASQKVFYELYTYEKEFPKLLDALTNSLKKS